MLLFTFNITQWRTKIPEEKRNQWDESYKCPVLPPGWHFQAGMQKCGIQVEPSGLPEVQRYSKVPRQVEIATVLREEYWKGGKCTQRTVEICRGFEYWVEWWSLHACKKTTQDTEKRKLPVRIRGNNTQTSHRNGYDTCLHQPGRKPHNSGDIG